MEGYGRSLRENMAESSVFYQLRSCSLELLGLLQNPNMQRSSALSRLLEILQASPPDDLQHLFDYTLFPLLLLLDAAVDCRSTRKEASQDKSTLSSSPTKPYKISDAIAEGVVQCLEELLKKCHMKSMDQMTVVLKKLTFGAMLSTSEASEEFRLGVVRSFRALLLSLHPCFVESCSCRQSSELPILLDKGEVQAATDSHSKCGSQSNECLLAFIQSQNASAAVGHWLSLLLNVANAEALRGLRGSSKLCVEAFFTLRILIAKAGTADTLAFFLPGVVSQIAKVLHASKTMISGAAGSSEATDYAIRGLAEFLMIVLHDNSNLSTSHGSLNAATNFHSDGSRNSQSFLEELRHLRHKAQNQSRVAADDSTVEAVDAMTPRPISADKEVGLGSLRVKRSEDWIEGTSTHVNKLLSMTFPHICLHPSKRVRRGLLYAIQGLLMNCSDTLKQSRLMLLECLCVLVCDDSEDVSMVAQGFLETLFSPGKRHSMDADVAEIFSRLLEKLPKVVLGSEEPIAVAHAQRMLALIYYSGPQLVASQLLDSPMKAARVLDVFSICLSQESVFAGSLDKLMLSRPSVGYLPSIAELKNGGRRGSMSWQAVGGPTSSEIPTVSPHMKQIKYPVENMDKIYSLPRMPPWFTYVGSQKLYQALAGILRLLGLSLFGDCRTEVSLSRIMEIPLGFLRKLVSEIRMKDYSQESWQSWYARSGSGQLLRQASTAVCMLNEMIFGMSDNAIDGLTKSFQYSSRKFVETQGFDACCLSRSLDLGPQVLNKSAWLACLKRGARQILIDSLRSILHEYLSPEVWDLPLGHKISFLDAQSAEDVNPHMFHDVAMLQKVIIDGVGIFSLCLGNDFASSGFLHSSLYLLLENLVCSDAEVRLAADCVLRIISATSGYPTVGHLVVANSDYIIDSLCRQLRHLDLNPHIPDVLAAMLSYIGIAHKILPILEEPMRAVSLELEILGRHQHPELTVPFLKAVAEIARAAKHEADSLPAEAESYNLEVQAKMLDVGKKENSKSDNGLHLVSPNESDILLAHSADELTYFGDLDACVEEWEVIWSNLNDRKRSRHIVASIASSCLTAVIPLLASAKEAACLTALGIIEDGIVTLARVEEAFKFEKETKVAIEQVAFDCSFYHLKDRLDAAADEGNEENRLLPAMNKIWPFLVACVRNQISMPVRRCLSVVSNVIQICGGDFFSRRFHTDGHHFWKLLSTSPFKRKPIRDDANKPLQLPYRSTSMTSEDPLSEVSNLKVQAAVLKMIAEISGNKKSASAFDAVLKKVSGLVVGISCSGVTGLRDASVNALLGLSSIDPDLIWLLLADVYYSMRNKDLPTPVSEFPQLAEVLPPPPSSKDYLYVQYGGQTYGFDIDFSSVETVFRRLHSEAFVSQVMY